MPVQNDNYETFFLRYADKDLSPAEMKEVEDFVAANPALRQELDMILATVLPAEPVSFLNKASLFKSSVAENVQENLLYHLDDELEPKKAGDIERLIAEDDAVSTEWIHLLKTKLDAAEKIQFPDKKLLYKISPARVISMRVMRYAIAAVLIGMGFFFGIEYAGNQPAVEDIAGVNTTTQPASQDLRKQHTNPSITGSTGNVPKVVNKTSVNNDAVSVSPTPPIAAVNNKEKEVKENIFAAKEKATENAVKNENIKDNNGLAKQTINAQKKLPEELIQIKDKEIAALIARPAQVKNKVIDEQLTLVKEPVNNASLTLLDNNATANNNHILFMDEEDVTRTKAGGFLRKLKRVVERNTLLKTGDEIKIAGFSFAVK